MNPITLYCGDSREILPQLQAGLFTACVSDPPYHLTNKERSKGFMDKSWDGGDIAFRPEFWAEVLRVLKPGAMLLAFGGTRTFHRLTCAVEDAGFEIRDCLMWLYGSGFPKSLDISKALDKAAGKEREVTGRRQHPTLKDTNKLEEQANAAHGGNVWAREWDITKPTTKLAKRWDGWGTALKPAWEPIILAMKPLDGTFAQNVQRHGVAGMNIDGSRIGVGSAGLGGRRDGEKTAHKRYTDHGSTNFAPTPGPRGGDAKGRWPANLLLDDEAARQLDAQTGNIKSGMMKAGQQRKASKGNGGYHGNMPDTATAHPTYGDSGGASRFFKICEQTESESCKSVNIAESILNQPNQAAAFAQSLAALADNHADRQLDNSIRRFTNAMQTGSNGSDESDMRMIRNTGEKCLQELRRTSAEMLNDSRANVAEIQKLTDITLITQSLLNILGSADHATSKSMCVCLALGAKDCESPTSRFMYNPKASRRDRTCDGRVENNHPTVKPRSLMEYLCRLVTPPGGGLILDPFMGSGSTALAALATGNRFVGIELEKENFETAKQRIETLQESD